MLSVNSQVNIGLAITDTECHGELDTLSKKYQKKILYMKKFLTFKYRISICKRKIIRTSDCGRSKMNDLELYAIPHRVYTVV